MSKQFVNDFTGEHQRRVALSLAIGCLEHVAATARVLLAYDVTRNSEASTEYASIVTEVRESIKKSVREDHGVVNSYPVLQRVDDVLAEIEKEFRRIANQ